MQTKDGVFNKGPGAITDVRKKRTFLQDAPEKTPEAPTDTSPWYVYTSKDLEWSGKKNCTVKAWKWTRFIDSDVPNYQSAKIFVQELESLARRYDVKIIPTQTPPKDVR